MRISFWLFIVCDIFLFPASVPYLFFWKVVKFLCHNRCRFQIGLYFVVLKKEINLYLCGIDTQLYIHTYIYNLFIYHKCIPNDDYLYHLLHLKTGFHFEKQKRPSPPPPFLKNKNDIPERHTKQCHRMMLLRTSFLFFQITTLLLFITPRCSYFIVFLFFF